MTLPTKVHAFIWCYLKKQPIAFILLFVTAAVWALNETCYPYFIKLIIDTLQGLHGDKAQVYQALMWPLIAIASVWLFMELSMRLQGMILVYAFPRLRANIRRDVFHHIRMHSYQYFLDHLAGDIASKMQDLPNSSERILEILIFSFTSFIALVIIAMILMYRASPIFAGILAVWILFHTGLTGVTLRRRNRYAKEHAESASTLSGKIIDSVTNIMNVRLFARYDYESRLIAKQQNIEIDKAHRYLWFEEKVKIFLGVASLSFIFFILFTLIHGWRHGQVTLGDFTLINMLAFSIMGFMWFISYQITMLMREVGRVQAALDLLAVEHDIQDKVGAKPLQVTDGHIQFDNIYFAYKKTKSLFDQFSLTINPAEKVGIVGFSGSGKSTLVNLLLRFFERQSGNIYIDGESIFEVTHASLCSQISMIPQDPSLFHRTLRDNIAYGLPTASDDDIISAAKAAYCHDFIMCLEHGYDTLVGERGVKLSGGQRQRIAIARAILKNAPILILDEATSSLDSVTEKCIQDSLTTLMHDRTTVVIAHRLSTLTNMDRIVVLDKGRLVESGTIETLLARSGHFAKLWRMQNNGFLPEQDSE